MAATEVEICNLAIARCGVKASIFNLADGTAEANLCNAVYPQARDACLAAFPWAFATKRALLVASTEDARTGWALVYALPDDCLTARYLHSGARDPSPSARVPFALEAAASGRGRVLLTDQEDAELVYTGRITDVTAYPPLFVDALAWLVASDLVMALSNKDDLTELALKRYAYVLAQAGGADFRQAQEDQPDDGEFIRARSSTYTVT